MVLEGLISENILLWVGVVVFEELILDNTNWGGCGHPVWTKLLQFPSWESVVVLKGHILNNFHLGGCGGCQRTDFTCFYSGVMWSF